MIERLRERISLRLEHLGINPFEAARRAGLERSYVNDLLIGKKGSMRPAQLAKVAQALECDPEYLTGLQAVPHAGQLGSGVGMALSGIIENGVWREPDAATATRKILPLAPDPRYPIDRQKCFLVRGDAAVDLGITDGSVVLTIDGIEAREGEPVVIRRRRESGEFETAIRLKEGNGYAAVPPAKLPVLPSDQVQVVGLVVLAVRTFGA